jgi:hypothetical protein
MKNNQNEFYVSPEFSVIEIQQEGVLCGSNEWVEEEEGNGTFN